jgi:hypothetical protein
MGWTDLADLHGITPDIELPIHGEVIKFPGRISAWAGSLLMTIRAAILDQEGEPGDIGERVVESLDLSGEDVAAMERELLGDGADDLERLGVTGRERQHVVNTLTVWHLSGEEAAHAAWEGQGKAPARPNRAARRSGRTSATGGKGAANSRAVGGGRSGSAGPKAGVASRGGTRSTRRS